MLIIYYVIDMMIVVLYMLVVKYTIQDFSTSSDIDWSLSIPEIDKQLYQKYELNSTEGLFIESKIKFID